MVSAAASRRLTLENVNWEKEWFDRTSPNSGNLSQYRLVSEAGEADLAIPQQVRPRAARREVFLTLKAPFRRLSQGALYHLVSTRLVLSESSAPSWAALATPHACAGRLVAEKGFVKEIGDHLGHRSAYASYLRQGGPGWITRIANFDLGGLR